MVSAYILTRTFAVSALFVGALTVRAAPIVLYTPVIDLATREPVPEPFTIPVEELARLSTREPQPVDLRKRIGCFVRGGFDGCLREDFEEEPAIETVEVIGQREESIVESVPEVEP